MYSKKTKLVIIGGGTGGIMLSSRLMKTKAPVEVTLIEPADTHWYHPAWTLVGAGAYDIKKTAKPMSEMIPDKVKWIKDYATGFRPEENVVTTANTGDISYDFLVVSPGLVMDTSLIEGLTEALGKGVVCSNYTDPEHTWDVIRNFKGGNAIFTQPTTPIKCGGAPQKIAYLAADYFRMHNMSDRVKVTFATPGTVIFGVKVIADSLMKVIDRYNIDFKPFYAPIKVDGPNKKITFKHIGPKENLCVVNDDGSTDTSIAPDEIVMDYDMLHIAPPQTAPKFVKESSLVNAAGWLDVNINTLQHVRYPNIFGMGDVAALPTAKTGAAIRKQVPVVMANILHLIKDNHLGKKIYEGYSSCPLVTGYGKMILAEFNYKNEFTPDPKLKQMLIFDSTKEDWRLWMLKKYGLPYLYWNKMMKGIEV
ncbi:MAG: NAD(P)/FAD-dependent oxidoreductase [Saprospiraceae bacterium]|nr:NAD(P)/FAD-dependent oxidoreductase [Saprospiraceae bacterium]MBP6567954.1 NAD(P)/FAD-dependent oxidoreductase [Saprospiraceae bacterium]